MAEITKPSGVDLNRVWAETGNKTDPGATKTAEGWLPEIPSCEVDNFMYYKRDKFIAHINQRGFPEWDGTTEYQANKSYIQGNNGTVYKCIQTHSNKNPVSAPDTASYWVIAFDPFDTSYTKAEGDLRYLRVGNNFSDVNNAALARTNLGLGTSSTLNTGTSAGNVMIVGAFGLGDSVSATSIPSGNCNSIVNNGFYVGGSSTANRFTGSASFTLLHINHSASYSTQFAQDTSNGNTWQRAKNNGVWQAWFRSYHTGNVSTYVQTLLDDVDAATFRNTLGLGSSATRNVGTSVGNVLEVGSFGVGAASNIAITINANSISQTGFYYLTSSSSNIPIASYGTIIHEQSDNTGYSTQLWKGVDTNRIFFRRETASVWAGWIEFFHTGNFDPNSKANLSGATFHGDITTYRSAKPNTGVIFFGNSGTKYLYWDGSSYNMPGGGLIIDGSQAFTAAGLSFWLGANGSYNQSGFQRFPGGFTIQWGVNAGTGTFSFPIAFTSVFCFAPTWGGGQHNDDNDVSGQAISLSQFQLYQSSGSGGNKTWVAFGIS